jgi:hypothetical protein
MHNSSGRTSLLGVQALQTVAVLDLQTSCFKYSPCYRHHYNTFQRNVSQNIIHINMNNLPVLVPASKYSRG